MTVISRVLCTSRCGLLPLLTVGLFWGASEVSAQESNLVSEKDFLADMPVVLSVSRLPQRLDETPGAVTVLDRDMIRRSGARDVADLLRWVPGFQVSSSFESVAPLVSYHGAFDSFSNRLELLIDGRSAYSPYFIGSIGPGLQTVALEDIERIEVLRGSNSAAYGARAILGVINIVTRHSADTLGKQVSVTAGENGIRDLQARLGWGYQGNTFRLSADGRADDGLVGANGVNRVTRANFRADFNPAPGHELQWRMGGYVINAGKGRAGNVDDPLRPTLFDSAYVQLDSKHVLSADEDLAIRFSHSQESYRDEFPYALQNISTTVFFPSDVYVVKGNGDASSDVLTIQHTQRFNSALRTVWGGEFRSEKVTSQALYNTDSPFVTDFTRLFANAEWRTGRNVVLNAGAMFENSSTNGETLSPRVMVNWHVTPNQTLRAGISKAFRPPSNFENFVDLRYIWNGRLLGVNAKSSGRLQSEDLVSKEIGYLGEFPALALVADVRLFEEQISGFIRQQNATLPKDYANTENFGIQGLEYQLKWQPWLGGQFIFNQAYTEIGSKLFEQQTLGTGIKGSTYAAPRLSSSLAYFQKMPGGLDLTLIHQDNATAVLAGSGWGNQFAMTRTDLRLAKAMRWGARRGDLALVVQNLGLPYQDFDPRFSFERRAYLTLRLED